MLLLLPPPLHVHGVLNRGASIAPPVASLRREVGRRVGEEGERWRRVEKLNPYMQTSTDVRAHKRRQETSLSPLVDLIKLVSSSGSDQACLL